MTDVAVIKSPTKICITPYSSILYPGAGSGCLDRYGKTGSENFDQPVYGDYSGYIDLGNYGEIPTGEWNVYDAGIQIGILTISMANPYSKKWSYAQNRWYTQLCGGSRSYTLTFNKMDGVTYSTYFQWGGVDEKTTGDYVWMYHSGDINTLAMEYNGGHVLASWVFEYDDWFNCDWTMYRYNSGKMIIGLSQDILGCIPITSESKWQKISEDACYDIHQRTITTVNADCSVESIIEEDRRYSDILCPPVTTGVVTLETYPPGATIMIGGQELVSPATIDLEPGTYEVIIDLGGYETIRETIVVGVGETTPLVVPMIEVPSIVPKVIAGTVLSIGLYGLIRKYKK